MNQRYVKSREAAYRGEINLLTDDLRFLLVDQADYLPNLSTHEFLSDIPGAAIVSTSPSLAGKSIVNGVFISDTANTGITFSAVTGDQSELLILYIHTGVATTARLVAAIDTATNLPVTPNSSNISVLFPDGKILDL